MIGVSHVILSACQSRLSWRESAAMLPKVQSCQAAQSKAAVKNRPIFMLGGVAALVSAAAEANEKKILDRGAEVAEFVTPKRRRTMAVNTQEKALYFIIGNESCRSLRRGRRT